MNLTNREKKILNKALNKGYLTLYDFHQEYKTPKIARETAQRFMIFGLINPDIGNSFRINESKIREILGLFDQSLEIYEN